MKENEAVEKIIKACKDFDIESAHISADEILIEFLAANGFKKLADTFDKESRNFWYA